MSASLPANDDSAEAPRAQAPPPDDVSTSGLSVLVVEDDANLRASLAALFERDDIRCEQAGTLEKARKELAEKVIDVVLVDLRLPDGNGLDLLAERTDMRTEPEFLVVTGNATVESAVDALREGALDYLTKPIDRARLKSALVHVARTRALKREVRSLRGQLRELGCFGPLVGRSAPMQQVYDLIERVAPSEVSVLLTGESGTGKELAALTIHQLSKRRGQPFLAVNCGAMSPTLIESELFGHEKGSFTGADRRRQGFFERANHGTLLLDEITEMPLDLQVKLLRVLEVDAVTRVGATEAIPIDVRVIAASNRDPRKAVADGALREDLLYRLNVFPIELPPLRDRGEDVELLAQHFLDATNERDGTRKRFGPDFLRQLGGMRWSGNVRELKNVVERAVILADDEITGAMLPKGEGASPVAAPEAGSFTVRVGTPLEEIERRAILATLESLNGSKKRAAEVLGVSLKTLYTRLSVYNARAEAEQQKS
jgi:DNA-binding NtrC family response regulator